MGIRPFASARARYQYHAHFQSAVFIVMSPARPLPPRDTHGPTPLSQCAPIADLAARAREIDRISQRIVPLLPTPLREHVGFVGLRNDRVLLLVESPAWATRARMQQTHILAAVRSLGMAASSITTKVAPLPVPSGGSAATQASTPHAAQTLRAAATAIADPDLRELLLELAANAESRSAR
ncbi:MAG TPA: DciA family protein [Rhodanobacteraceae bacterium]|nr:DciA family protein [Rhodanobacteraceae bacterium]